MPRSRPELLARRSEERALLGNRLAEMRSSAGVTQAQAAASLQVAQTTIAKLEAGLRQLTFLEALKLAAAYGVAVTALDPAEGEEPGGTPEG